MTNFTIVNEDKKNKKASMTLTGHVASFNSENSFNSAKFIGVFNELKANNTSIHIDIVNFYGGSITEGIPIYNHIKETHEEGKIEITGKIEGLAASMGSIIAMAIPVDKLEMGNMARLMNHRAKGGAYGTADEVANTANMIQSYEDDMIDILASRTGMTKEAVKAKWMDGLDHFIKSDEAIKLKLVGRVSKSKINKALPKNFTDANEAYQFYNTHLNLKHLNTDMELENQIREVLNLGAADDVVNAVSALKTENDKGYKAKYEALVAANQERDEAEAEALVQKAIDGKHIKAEQKDSFLALFKADHANAKNIVEGMLGAEPETVPPSAGEANKKLADFVGGLGPEGKKAETVEKNYEWYELNDPQALLEMKKNDPEKFEKLFEESLNE